MGNGDIMLKNIVILDRSEIQKLISMEECIELIERVQVDFSNGETISPLRLRMEIESDINGRIVIMPSFLQKNETLTCKLVTFYPQNPEKYDLPTVTGYIMLMEAGKGILLGLLEATYITALRTGASAALGAKFLAKKGDKTIGIFGSGTLARSCLEGICTVISPCACSVYSRNSDKREAYAGEMAKKLDLDITPTADTEKLIRNSDIILCATSTIEPVVNGNFVRPGTTIISVGCNTPDSREFDSLTIQRAKKVVVESEEASLKECGELIIPIKEGIVGEDEVVYGEIGEIIAGKNGKKGREFDDEIIIYKSTGLAVQDGIVTDYVYKRYQASIAGGV